MNTENLIEEARKIYPNRFLLSKIIIERVKQLQEGAKPKVEVEEKTPLLNIALKEIIDGKFEVINLEELELQ
jgi:DNA-directed RNA polymerase subunit K/omega